MDENELKALVSLLDDGDQDVVAMVEGKIRSLGGEIIPFLEKQWEESFDPNVQTKIEDLIHELQFEVLKQRLEAWRNTGGEDLLEGMWLIATYQYPDVELEDLRKQIEDIYQQVWLEFKDNLHPFDQVKIINSVIFHKLRFAPNTKNFHSPANSMINVVLENKKSNPLGLCVIYLLIAQKLGLPVSGVNLPNLFILTYKEKENQFYINAFNRGVIFSRDDIDNYLDHLRLPPKPVYYEPTDHLTIVKRVLRNLLNAFENLGDYDKLDEIKQLFMVVADGEIP
ncbi:MAG: transglutaminase-like domain-containing protein [Bacteroidota bacterium]